MTRDNADSARLSKALAIQATAADRPVYTPAVILIARVQTIS